MLEKKNERKANFKKLELEQGKKEFEFEKQKYEAAERLGETPTGDWIEEDISCSFERQA